MKVQSSIYTALATLLISMPGCIKDKGNYSYKDGSPVTIRFQTTNIDGLIDNPVTIDAIREYSDPTKTASDYGHEWYVSDQLVGTDSILVYNGAVPGTLPINYCMVDKATKVKYFSTTAILRLASPYQTGYGILYEKNGESELAHIRYDAAQNAYVDDRDIYKRKNNGESLGSKPIKLKNYPMTGVWSLVVMQQGGQGTVELDSYSLQKRLRLSDAFAGSAPANIDPINMGFYPNAHLLVNTNGEVYPRLFSNSPVPFSMPWLNIPMTTLHGMKITDLWNPYSNSNLMNFMYDALNNRILYLSLNGPNPTGGWVVIDTLPSPAPATPYPADHVNFNHMGDWEYVWGGSFNEIPNSGNGASTDGVVLMRKPGETQIYLQSFTMRNVNRVITFSPKTRKPFTGSSFVNADSKYLGIKSRNFIFFSGGPGNTDLYYYDMITGNAAKLFTSFGSKITAMCQSDNFLELAVGLEDGTVVLYNISDPSLTLPDPVELHRLTGLGRIADITVKGSIMR